MVPHWQHAGERAAVSQAGVGLMHGTAVKALLVEVLMASCRRTTGRSHAMAEPKFQKHDRVRFRGLASLIAADFGWSCTGKPRLCFTSSPR